MRKLWILFLLAALAIPLQAARKPHVVFFGKSQTVKLFADTTTDTAAPKATATAAPKATSVSAKTRKRLKRRSRSASAGERRRYCAGA